MTNEEFVRANWERLEIRCDMHIGWIFFTDNALYRAVHADTPEKLYAKGAEFTRERLEQIRQMQVEIEWIAGEFSKRECLEHVECIRRRALQARILARLDSALADLKQGMRTAASNGARSDSND